MESWQDLFKRHRLSEDGRPAHTMPGVWQRFYRIAASVGLNLSFMSTDELLPDSTRVWQAVLIRDDSVLGPDSVVGLADGLEWTQGDSAKIPWILSVRESDIEAVVERLRSHVRW